MKIKKLLHSFVDGGVLQLSNICKNYEDGCFNISIEKDGSYLGIQYPDDFPELPEFVFDDLVRLVSENYKTDLLNGYLTSKHSKFKVFNIEYQIKIKRGVTTENKKNHEVKYHENPIITLIPQERSYSYLEVVFMVLHAHFLSCICMHFWKKKSRLGKEFRIYFPKDILIRLNEALSEKNPPIFSSRRLVIPDSVKILRELSWKDVRILDN